MEGKVYTLKRKRLQTENVNCGNSLIIMLFFDLLILIIL